MIFLISLVVMVLLMATTPTSDPFNGNSQTLCVGGNSCAQSVQGQLAPGCILSPDNLICILSGTSQTLQGNQYIGDALTIAFAIAGTFIVLGFAAGIFGAGSLANIIAGVGIIIAFITFINGIVLTSFGNLDVYTALLFNAVVDTSFIYLIWLTLLSGGKQ